MKLLSSNGLICDLESIPFPGGRCSAAQSKAVTHTPAAITQKRVAADNGYNESQAETPSLAGCCLGLENSFRINKTKPEAIALAADFSPPTQALHADPSGLCQKHTITPHQRELPPREWLGAFLGVGGYFCTNSDNGTGLPSGRRLLISKATSQPPPPLHSLIFNILPLLYDWCITHNQLLRWLLLGKRRELLTFQCWVSWVTWLFYFFIFLVLHTTTCILHCTAANHSFPAASDTLQKGDWECQEQRSQMMPLLQKRALGSWCPALHSRTRKVPDCWPGISAKAGQEKPWCLTSSWCFRHFWPGPPSWYPGLAACLGMS